ncbi:MAG: hypothetical protein ACLVB5_12275 [Christensenellales bacterium]
MEYISDAPACVQMPEAISDGGEAVIQIFLERADAEHHAAGEAPLVELVARVGQQHQRKGRPNHKREHKQMRSRKRSPIRADAAQKIKHVFFSSVSRISTPNRTKAVILVSVYHHLMYFESSFR